MNAFEFVYRYEVGNAQHRPMPADAQAALARLNEGGQRNATSPDEEGRDESGTTRRVIRLDARDLGFGSDSNDTPPQRPYAAVLGCSDARVPIELIFNEGPNDLFVVRVAGNALGSDVLGSLKYAMEHLRGSLKLIAVLGHSGCGAVSAAVDVLLAPKAYLTLATNHELRNILDRLLLVVHATAGRMQQLLGPDVSKSPHYRSALIEATILLNAALTAHTLQKEIGTASTVRSAYGAYLIGNHAVWAPRVGSELVDGLAYPPTDAAGFGMLADNVLHSERIAALLAGGVKTSC